MNRSWKIMGATHAAVLLALAGSGCGDDDGGTDAGPADSGRDTGTMEDAGPPDEDSGMPDDDAGPGDSGTMDDAGMVDRNAYVRAAHMVPNAGGVRICAQVVLPGDMLLPGNALPARTMGGMPGAGAITFRSVSGYLPFPAVLPTGAPAQYRIRIYDAVAYDGASADGIQDAGVRSSGA